MTPQEASCYAEQNGDNSLELLRRFLETHHLSLEQLAGLFRISPLTVEEWFSEGMAPPAAFLALAVLFDAGKIMSGRERHGHMWRRPASGVERTKLLVCA